MDEEKWHEPGLTAGMMDAIRNAKPVLFGILFLALYSAIVWAIVAYSAADLAWPVTALSWDWGGHPLAPPGGVRFLMIVTWAFFACVSFVIGAAIGSES